MIATWIPYALLVAALVTAAAVALARACRRAGVPQRWVWLLALAVSLALPATRLLPAAAPPPVARTVIGTFAVSFSDAVLPSPSSSWLSWDALVVPAWILSSVAVLLVLGMAELRLRRTVRAGRATELDGIPVRLTRTLGPAVVGFLRPEIVVPAWAAALPEAERRLVLAHERAHRDARDQWLLAGGLAAIVLMPWNPFVWWQLARLREAIEIDCDARLVRGGASKRTYGALLLDLVARPHGTRAPLIALATPTSFLSRRLTMLAERQPRMRATRIVLAGFAASALLILACETTLPTGTAVVEPGSASAATPTPPVLLGSPGVRYPALLRHAGIEGEVRIEFVVDAEGRVQQGSARILRSSHKAFEKPAVEMIEASAWRPATSGGRPVAAPMQQTVRFDIAAEQDKPLPDATVTAPRTDTTFVFVTPGRR